MKSFINEFKDFISRGNVLDMAVGVVVGGAFSKIVTSLVDNIIMPLVGIILGGHDFSSLTIRVKDAHIYYGLFIQNIVDFLIVALCLFIVIKAINKMKNLKKKDEALEEKPVKSEEVLLLEDIRDLLKKKTK